MDCRQIRGLLPAYLDGELSDATRAEIEAHLADCPSCRRVANDYRRDMQVLSYQLGVAPWLPVNQRPWEATRAGGFWTWLRPIGHKAVAGTAMVALVALIVTGALALHEMANNPNPNGNPQATQTVQAAAASSATSTATATHTGSVGISTNPEADQIMFALSDHKLVWPIDKEIHTEGGKTIYLSVLGIDRTATFLTLNQEEGGSVEIPEIDLKLSNGKTLRPFSAGSTTSSQDERTQSLLIYPGMDSDVTKVTLHVRGMASQPAQDIPLRVNLTPIKQANLPQALPVEEKQQQSDLEIKLGDLTPGVAVSMLTWQAIDTKKDEPANLGLIDAKVMADGANIPIVRTVMPDESGTQGAFWLLNLPKNRSFRLTFGSGHAIESSGWSPYYSWAFTVDPTRLLASAQATASAEAQAQATPSAVATPTSTETALTATTEATVTPSPTSTAFASSTLPAELLYLAPAPNGGTALWAQPSDGAAARMIYHPDADITNFWLVPSSQSVAVQMGDSGPVELVNLNGTPTGAPTLPDGQAIHEYVPSPDGKLIAYIPMDQHSVWVGHVDGEMYQIDKTNQKVPQTIHDLTWAPTSDSFSYHLAQIESPDRLVVSTPGDSRIIWESKVSVMSSAYAPDGKSLVYSDGSHVYVVQPSTGKQVDVTPAALKKGDYELLNVTWRTDGRIGLVAHADGSVYGKADLWLLQSNGSQAWRAHVDIGAAIAFEWAPSGDGFITEAPVPASSTSSDQSQSQNQSQSYQLYWYPKLASNPVPLDAANALSNRPSPFAWLR